MTRLTRACAAAVLIAATPPVLLLLALARLWPETPDLARLALSVLATLVSCRVAHRALRLMRPWVWPGDYSWITVYVQKSRAPTRIPRGTLFATLSGPPWQTVEDAWVPPDTESARVMVIGDPRL